MFHDHYHSSIILLMLATLANYVQTATLDNHYCQLKCDFVVHSYEHTVCNRTKEECGAGEKCGADFREINLSNADRQYILDIHNYLRNKVASGDEKHGLQPSSSNMRAMVCSKWKNQSLTAHVDVSAEEMLVLPGDKATFMCRVGVPLQYCRAEIPGSGVFNLNRKLSNNEVIYYGDGLNAGQCGFTIIQVSEKNNGLVNCSIGVNTETSESVGRMQLIVAKAPKDPELDLSKGQDQLGVYKINDVLQASCLVKDGRPVANISWWLDDVQIYGTELSTPTVVDMVKENLQSKLQNLTRHLQASDNGKRLRCVAYHMAFPNKVKEVSRVLDIKYAPLPQANPIDKFGYTIGNTGVISIIVEANPKPQIEWTIDGQRIREGGNDNTGRMEAEAARDLGKGKYEVNLRIARISKQDTEKEYTLTAYNNMGSQTYRIKISTSPEPEGLDLGVGPIIGIVVAVLLLLFVVFLIVFAKATDRWCFSGGATIIDYTTGDSAHPHSEAVSGDGVDNPHHQVSQEYINGSRDARNIGESSDTESTDVHKSSRNILSPVKLTKFFKRTKENKGSVEEIDGRPEDPENPPQTGENAPVKTRPLTAEEKEGLVYAELDLKNPNTTPVVKNDEKTEYAEIIYTTNNEDAAK